MPIPGSFYAASVNHDVLLYNCTLLSSNIPSKQDNLILAIENFSKDWLTNLFSAALTKKLVNLEAYIT